MAQSGRKSLVWDIRRSLLTLEAGELFQIARSVGPVSDEDQSELMEGDHEGCFDHISSFMHSKQLIDLEDSGMAQLLMLKDTIDTVKNRGRPHLASERGNFESDPLHTTMHTHIHSIDDNNTQLNNETDTGIITEIGDNAAVPSLTLLSRHSNVDTASPVRPKLSNTVAETTKDELLKMLSNYEEIGRRLRQSVITAAAQPPEGLTSLSPQTNKSHSDASPGKPTGHVLTQQAREGMISLKELSYLQRREFKVQGGQVGDHSSDISYNNIWKQIEEGIKEGFSESEIVRGVLRIIKPGTFKDMLINKDDLSILELRGFLQAHLREKNSTELFQELMCARQDDNETPQQFLYRVIGLKQRVLFTSKLSDASIKYSAATVQDVFLHTVYQGLGQKHSDIRRELKPLLSNSGISDETILCHIMRITSEESERQKRIGSSRRQATSAHSAQIEVNNTQEHTAKHEKLALTAKTDPIKELAAKVEALTSLVEAMTQQSQLRKPDLVNQYPQNKVRTKKDKLYGCPTCVDQNRPECCHCFSCGEEGHRAVGCLKRQKNQGNVNRSLQRGTQ